MTKSRTHLPAPLPNNYKALAAECTVRLSYDSQGPIIALDPGTGERRGVELIRVLRD